MRVLYFYPWGNFYPVTCGSDRVACNHLAYFQHRQCEVHCLFPRGFGRGPGDSVALAERFPCIRSVRWVEMAVKRFTLREALFAFERAARSSEFRALATEPFQLFFTNYVLSAPFACVLPRSTFKVVETVDLLSGMFRTIDLLSRPSPPPAAIIEAEERHVFGDIELDLYRSFDRAVMISANEAEAIVAAGYPSAVYVPQPFTVDPAAPNEQGRSEYDLVFVGSENHLNTFGIKWFYRHIYLPYLRRRQVRLAVAGRVCENLDFEDALVTQLGFLNNLQELYRASKLVVVPIFDGTGTAIKLHEALAAGRAVVSTPVGARGIDPASGALACVDMMSQPRQTAEIILDLLGDEDRRRAMQHRARSLMGERYSHDAYVRAMDHVLESVLSMPERVAA
jgi:glycosyltransferase involved in cell wall biosynthesis